MEEAIKKTFEVLARGQSALIAGLERLIGNHLHFFAIYVEVTFIAILFMGFILKMRRDQRMAPAPKPEVIVSPVIPPPAPPDRTLHKAVLWISVLVLIILLFVAPVE